MDGGTGMTGLPDAFTERMKGQLGTEELALFMAALEECPVRGIRMNPFKPFTFRDDYITGGKIPWTSDGYYLSNDSKAGATLYHEAGAFYLQEPAAMLPAEILDPKPGERILDLCAAPGGKSTQIGLKMHGEGVLVCNEPILKRTAVLSRNIERIGIPNAVVTCSYPQDLPTGWNGVFDGVLADAPCSGEGMFRRDPETRQEWSPERAAGCAERQREILREAARFVRPGGRLVYSTCTYNPEENERMVSWFMENHPDFDLESFCLPEVDGKSGMFLCLPHRMKGEGQFAAKLRRKGENRPGKLMVPFPEPGKDSVNLLRKTITGIPEANGLFGNLLIRAPESPDLRGVKVLRAGLHLAEIRGKNVFPDHAAALSIFSDGIPVAEISEKEAADYLRGQEISGEGKGWLLIAADGLILGWGKGSEGRIRNHYPKGLRKNHILISD